MKPGISVHALPEATVNRSALTAPANVSYRILSCGQSPQLLNSENNGEIMDFQEIRLWGCISRNTTQISQKSDRPERHLAICYNANSLNQRLQQTNCCRGNYVQLPEGVSISLQFPYHSMKHRYSSIMPRSHACSLAIKMPGLFSISIPIESNKCTKLETMHLGWLADHNSKCTKPNEQNFLCNAKMFSSYVLNARIN